MAILCEREENGNGCFNAAVTFRDIAEVKYSEIFLFSRKKKKRNM